MIAAMDGSACLAALGTPTNLSVHIDLDREVVGALLDAAADATLGNGKRNGHTSHDGKLSLSRHRPESIGRHPRKVSKSHETGSIPLDCRAVKARLVEMCQAAGRPGALVRIFCRELEALYLANLRAVEDALGIPGLADRQREARFRAPDGIASPSRELAALTKGRYQKIGGSRAIGPLLDVDNTRSPSFRVLVAGLRRLCEEAERHA